MEYDVIIVGGGPAGLTAGIYTARSLLRTLIIEKAVVGGQIASSFEVENYSGLTEVVSGFELTDTMRKQCEGFGARLISDEFIRFEVIDGGYEVHCENNTFKTKGIILAMGAHPKKLGAKGEDTLASCGVSYCATCDGAFFRDKNVIVVGGGDTALEEALFLTKFAKTVGIVYRRNVLRATKILQDRARQNDKIQLRPETVIEEIKGKDFVESVVFKDVKTGKTFEEPIDGVFMFVGQVPNTETIKGQIPMNEAGYVLTNEKMETPFPGVYVAGDMCVKPLRQVVTAASDGAVAAVQLSKYLESLE
ncbi:MAG: thioredoxin-disulfide reductase [Eubacteriaceae bacterium]|jgi:thioredoxin reductase (NADPH)|nr:thioredoxin-disulfide reductase [Eubacteriaceae bacterium]